MAKTFFNILNRKSLLGFGAAFCSILTSTGAPDPTENTTSHSGEAFKASRYANVNADDYIQDTRSRLAITTRNVDPFGKAQDPLAKPIQAATVKSQADKKTLPPSTKPFSDVVKLIRVTTIMPAEGRFLIGTRSISRGDVIPLIVQGKRYQVKVLEVSAERILFRDLNNAENGELRLDVMPQGMSRGVRGVLAPGMKASEADAPIEIDTPGSRP
jgi:hypothetical protein